MAHRMTQEQVTGSLLGMAIGDSLGLPLQGQSAESLLALPEAERHRFRALEFEDGAELAAGEFSGVSEGVLCIVESFTTNNGQLDLDNIEARMQMLSRGASRRWMTPSTALALDALADDQTDTGRLDLLPMGDIAARGIPIGMVHANPRASIESVRDESRSVAAVTHAGPLAAEAALLVATAVRIAGLREIEDLSGLVPAVAAALPESALATQMLMIHEKTDGQMTADWLNAVGAADTATSVAVSALLTASARSGLMEAIFAAVDWGGATNSRAAITGAIVGAFLGAGAIPQRWIDDLEGRVYILLASPWFYRTIQFRYPSLPVTTP